MKFKKLTVILLLFVLTVMSVTFIAADENINYSNQTQNITFEGVNFTIPMGFGESKDSEDFYDLGSDGETCFYINEYKGEIVITVISDWMGMSLNELKKDNATKSSINGHEGWNYTQDGLNYFAYVHDDKGILVGVTNETRLYEVIL